MTISTLFDWAETAPPRARRTDPWTSHAAAEELTSAEAHYRAIGKSLRNGPATIYQLSARTGLSHVQIARRLPEMQRLGQAQPTGETATGPNGRQCRVWAA